VHPIRRSRALVCLDLPPTAAGPVVLLANPRVFCFHTAPIQVYGHGVRLAETTTRLLALEPGDLVWTMPLDW
jgi:hypothetical protein